jgi:hypothetical protein
MGGAFMKPRYCSLCRRCHDAGEECWGSIAGYALIAVGFVLFAAAAVLGCGSSVAVEVCDDDCDADADGDADEAFGSPWGDADSDCDVDADGDGDGDVDGDTDVVDSDVDDGPCIWPVAWSAALGGGPEGGEPRELEEHRSALLVWPDGLAVFWLTADVEGLEDAVELVIVLEGVEAGELCTYPGCSAGLSAGLRVATAPGTPGGCDASGGASEALGYATIPGLFDGEVIEFEFQFTGSDGCMAQIIDGELVIDTLRGAA